VFEKGKALKDCWGFIDCTIRGICRLTLWQRTDYNTHHKHHAVKYSAVKCPHGLIYHLYGPVEGRRNDNMLLRQSGLLERLENHASCFGLYSDPAYPVSQVLCSPVSRLELGFAEQEFNRPMSSCRECVEWGFADIIRLWAYLDYDKEQALFKTAIGRQYRFGTLLTNIHICLYGSETSLYFNCAPSLLCTYCNLKNKNGIEDTFETRKLQSDPKARWQKVVCPRT